MKAQTRNKTLQKKQAIKLYEPIENLENVATKKDIELLRKDLGHVEKNLSKDINWLKWIGGLGLPFLAATMFYLHSDTSKRMDRMEIDIKEIRKEMQKGMTELKELIIERTGSNK